MLMASVDPVAEADFQSRVGFCQRVLELANGGADRISVRMAGDFHTMAAVFLCKQIDHMTSLLILARAGYGTADMVVIARIMFEGMACLRWARMKSVPRSRRWANHGNIHDYYEIRWCDKNNRPVDSGARQRNLQWMRRYGRRFLTDRAKAERRRRRPMPDRPYEVSWHGPKRIAQVVREAKFEELYDSIYRTSSGVIHWAAGGAVRNIQRTATAGQHHSWVLSDAIMALAMAFQGLLITIDLANKALGLGVEAELQALSDEYLRVMRTAAP